MDTKAFEIGDEITLENDRLLIKSFLGSGGQGEVYRVEYNRKDYALKWYNANTVKNSPQLRYSLMEIINDGAPTERFLWPLKLVAKGEQFGYLMNLRPDGYRCLTRWVIREFQIPTDMLMKGCIELAHSFRRLHSLGLSYKDINWGNIFIHEKTGDILICDNDNVSTNKENISGIIGYPSFMAPEIVEGDAAPSTATDLFSLAILFYYMLHIAHPLEGEIESKIHVKEDLANKLLYGYKAVYIWDKKNSSNRPVRGIHNNAIITKNIFPDYIEDLFYRTFTDGILVPSLRVTETEWMNAFMKFFNSIFICSHCKKEIIYTKELLANNGLEHKNHLIELPPRGKLNNKEIVVLKEDFSLYPLHYGDDKREFSEKLCTVYKQNGKYYMVNKCCKTMSVLYNNQTISIPKGSDIELLSGEVIMIDNKLEMEVRV